MVKHLTRALLVVQTAAAIGIYFAILRFSAIQQAWLAALLAIVAVILVRMAIVANNFFLAWRYSSETPAACRLSKMQACRMFFQEFKSSMLSWSWTLPFFGFDKRACAASGTPAVLLIHGYGCNSGYWHGMSRKLSAAGIFHHAVDLIPVFGSIDDFVPIIAEAVTELCRDSGQDRIVIVAHSMGGLAVRAYLDVHGDSHIAKVITLGTPHHGTGLAHFGIGKNSLQMRWLGTAVDGTPCEWLSALATREPPSRRALFVSIYSHHDNIIAPQTSSHLPGARNIALHGIGHVALGMSAHVQDIVIAEILSERT